MTTPPAGKALIIFHRPSSIHKERYPIFDGDGRLLCELPDATAFLFVCDPGQYLFIAGDLNRKVSVVSAEVEENRVYDVFVEAADIGKARASFLLGAPDRVSPRFVPLAKGDPRRVRLAEYGRRERWMVSAPRTDAVVRYEQENQARIQKIKAEFVGGPKSDQVQHLHKDDYQ